MRAHQHCCCLLLHGMKLSRPTLVRVLAIAMSLAPASPLSNPRPQTLLRNGGVARSASRSCRCVSRRPPYVHPSLPNKQEVAAAGSLQRETIASQPTRRRIGVMRHYAGADPWFGEAVASPSTDPARSPLGQQRLLATETFATAAAQVSSTVRSSPTNDAPTFRELFTGRLPDWLLSRLEQLGFASPTLVQRQALEVIMAEEKNDAVLHAQTGSGKTLAFLLPLFALIQPSRAAVQGIVVVPTRELGLQVAGVAKCLAAATGNATGGKVQVMSVLEGSSNKRQRAWAWADPPHIVIGNPDNLSKLVTTGAIRVNAVSYVVVDEVDACLLSKDTRASLHELLARSLSPTYASEDDNEDEEKEEAATLIAAGAGRVGGAAVPAIRRVKDRQTVFSSATIPQHNHFIRQCVQQQWTLMEPVHVQVHAKEAMPSCLSHFYVVCPPEQKLPVLRALIKREFGSLRGVQASGTEADTRGLVFALPAKPLEEIASSLDRALGGNGHENGRDRTEPLLAEFLREELGLNARADAMSLFREGKTRLLVSTDMAARGLDVPEITHVFNLDLPIDGEGYVHRGGRAGRLGRPGKVISIVTPAQEFVIRRLGNGIGVDIKRINLGSKKRNARSGE